MIALLLVMQAFAHGGEDHGSPPPAVVTADATTVSIAASSSEFEAVLRVKRGPAGTPVGTTLLLDDYETSTPIADATASATLAGPSDVTLAFKPSTAGTYLGSSTFPADGDYAGALVITTATSSDLLALSGLRLGALAPPVVSSAPSKIDVLRFFIAGLVVFVVGYGLGRRRGAASAVVLVAAAVAARQVSAHGGEDHGDAVSPGAAPTSGALHLPMESQFLVGLRTVRLVQDSFQAQVPALGRFVASPGGSATLRSPVSGELGAPPSGFPLPGSLVKAGQVLGIVRGSVGSADRTAMAQGRQQAAVAVAEARRQVALAERDAAQVPNLEGGISDRERLDREQSVAVARSALAGAEGALAATGDGSGVVVRAPVDGHLGSALVRPGDQVQAGDPLFRVVDAAGLWMEAKVPERLAAGVLGGASATVLSAAFPHEPLTAVILDPGQEADPLTGTLTVTLAVDAKGHDLHPGMSATAWLGRGPVADTLVVPDAAVVDSNGMTIGFVKTGPEQFELRELELGDRSGQSWQVLSGLKVGERVVVDGTYTLRSIAGR